MNDKLNKEKATKEKVPTKEELYKMQQDTIAVFDNRMQDMENKMQMIVDFFNDELSKYKNHIDKLSNTIDDFKHQVRIRFNVDL